VQEMAAHGRASPQERDLRDPGLDNRCNRQIDHEIRDEFQEFDRTVVEAQNGVQEVLV